MNPFKLGRVIQNQRQWKGSKRVFRELEANVDQGVNTCILGPEGSGKTALLNCFFTYDYKKQMAEEMQILICSVDFSVSKDRDDICNYLMERIHSALQLLLSDSAECDRIQRDMARFQGQSSRSRLQALIECLHEKYRYLVVLVMDDFQYFTSSENITMEHHEVLRGLIEKRALQFIVATNYDLTEDSLTPDVKGSYLLQKITEKIVLEPLSLEDAKTWISEKQARSEYRLSEDYIEAFHLLTGGIPSVFMTAAKCAYENMEEHDGVLDTAGISRIIYQAVLPMLRNWGKYLTAEEVRVFEILKEHIPEEENGGIAHFDFAEDRTLAGAVALLLDRGLLRRGEMTDEFGNPIRTPDTYVRFNSYLLQKFCTEGGLQRASQGSAALSLHSAREARENTVPAPSVTNIYVSGDYVGGNKNTQLNQGISAQEWMSLFRELGDSRAALADRIHAQLSERFSSVSLPKREDYAYLTDEEYEAMYDNAVSEAGSKMVQDLEVDENGDIIGVSKEELKTMDQRFQEAKKRCRPTLPDSIFECLSERCSFYLKLSVIVEDALNFPGALQLEDFSPQLVLYGKTLEQCLRDKLYDLFHDDQEICDFVMQKNRDQVKTFGNVLRKDTLIGNYTFVIFKKKARLQAVSNGKNHLRARYGVTGSWYNWWQSFGERVRAATEIRNKADHAGDVSPGQADLDQLYDHLIGTEEEIGILKVLDIGKELSA